MCRAAVSQFAGDINRFFQEEEIINGEVVRQAGENANGVPVTSIMLNNAVDAFNDRQLIINAQNTSSTSPGGPFLWVGYDGLPDRQRAPGTFLAPRELFSFNFFRLGLGVEGSSTPNFSTTPRPSTDNQRRLMIIDGTTREILFSFTPTGSASSVRAAVSSMREVMINAVNSVTPAVQQTPLEAYLAGFGLPAGMAGENDDPDGDGLGNRLEFALALDPLSSEPEIAPRVAQDSSGLGLLYRTNAAATDTMLQTLESDSLENFAPLELNGRTMTTTDIGDGVEEVRIELPPTLPRSFFQFQATPRNAS